jgi:hypothetical protein
MHFLLARAGGGELFDGGGSSSGGGGGLGGSGGGMFIFGGGGGAIGLVVLVLIVTLAFRTMSRGGYRRGRWGGGPRGGGPWGGGGGGPWSGGPWGGRRQGPWPANSQNPPGQGSGNGGANGGPSSTGGGTPAGGDAGWAAGGGDAPAGGDAGWAAGGAGAPPGGGAAWPGDDNPDWLHDTRPAAASIPGELFPEAHARAVQAASPVDVGLAAIKAHDPGFDLEQFTEQVQRSFFIVEEAWSDRKPEMSRQVMADSLWLQHRDQIQGYVNGHKRNMLDYLAVSNIWPVAAHSDSRYDTITVRIVAACADYDVDDRSGKVVRGDQQVKQWQEDWTFERSSQAVTKEGGTSLGAKCPNCGAPLDVDLTGTCRYCKAPIMSGEYDWVLARISQVG